MNDLLQKRCPLAVKSITGERSCSHDSNAWIMLRWFKFLVYFQS